MDNKPETTEEVTATEQPEAAGPEQEPPVEAASAAPEAAGPAETPEAGEEAAVATEAPADAASPEAEPPVDETEALRAELADTQDKMLRALAETENVRRRAQRDKEEASKYAVTGFAREMVGVADNFRRAIEAVDNATRESNEAVRNMIVGVEMTERELLGAFERFGIKPIAAEGARFDSNLHEAMFEIEDADKPQGTVVQVMETGYVLHDRLLRPAKVGVSKGGPKAPPPEENAADASDDTTAKSGQQAYEKQGDPAAGAQVDEEL